MMALSGDYVRITGGGRIQADTAVDDQVLISITGDRSLVEGMTFKATMTTAINTNPMIFLGLTGSNGGRVVRNRFIPLRGITCVKGTAGQNNTYSFNDFQPNETTVYEASDSEITSNHAATTYLGEVWRCIDLQHDGWAMVQGNRARYLGRPTLQGDAFLNYDFDSTYYPDEQGGLHEAGHLNFVGNYVEDCPMPVYVRLNGCRWGQIVGNSFANSLSGIATTAEAALIMDIGDEASVASAVNVSATASSKTYALSSGSWAHTPQAGDKILVTGSLTGNNLGWKTVASATSNTVVVTETLDDESAASTTIISGHPTDDVIVSGNQFHNIPFATTSASDILLGHAFRIVISGNHFSNLLGEYSITFEDTDLAQDIQILANSFEGKAWFVGSENQPTTPIRTLAGSSGARYVFGGNTVTGYSGTAIVTHSSGTPTGEVFEDGLQDSSDGDAPDGSTTVANLTTNIVMSA